MTARGPHVLMGDEQPDDGREEFQFFHRATVEDATLPPRAKMDRDTLPMSTGVPLLSGQSARITWHIPITSHTHTRIYKIRYFQISSRGTAGGWADWIVNDIKINDVSQFVQSDELSGAVFADKEDTNTSTSFVRFTPVQIGRDAIDVVVDITYIGLNRMGCPFFGSMVGTVDMEDLEI